MVQLDRTRIAVRERGLLDICDLALRVVRREAPQLVGTFLVGAAPLLILNHLLIGWMIGEDQREEFFYLDDAGLIARFIWSMSLLVAVEAPLASLLTIAYLGQAMFVVRPSWKSIFADVVVMFPRIVWCHVLVRGVFAVWLLNWSLERGGEFEPMIEIMGMGTLAIYVFGLRFLRPFITEIVLLERNPLTTPSPRTLTVSRRSYQLHHPSAGDLFVRGLGTGILAILLTLSVFGTFIFCSGVFLNDWQPGYWMLTVMFPVSLWIVAGYLAVVRFLSYLDLRIRHEGWEVELRLRAEGERLRGSLVDGLAGPSSEGTRMASLDGRGS